MNRFIIIIIAIAAFFSSCQKSKEEKINSLVADRMNKTLYHPESYEGVETEIDSAFTPFDAPEFYEKTLRIAKLGVEISQYENEMKSAKSSMAIWSGSYLSEFGKNEYNEAKEKYDHAAAEKESAEKKAQNIAEELKKELEKKPVFIGLKARHKFRANNNAGQTVFGETIFLFNQDLTNVVAEYDMGDEEYLAVQQMYKMMRGEE